MNKNFLVILTIFVVVLFLTGCSQNAATSNQLNTVSNSNTVSTSASDVTTTSSSDTIKDITIEAHSFGFTQTGPQINKGDKVRITFTVTDGMHSLSMSGYNIEFTRMGPGQTQSTTFIADKSGTFEYHCNNPCGAGHADMVGKLIVN